MSFDPFASASDVPPEYGPAAPLPGEATSIRQRVQAPAIALIVAGVLNLFLAAVPALQAFRATRFSAAEFEELIEKQNPNAREEMKQLGWTPEGVLRGFTWVFVLWAVGDFLASFLVILGGVRMLNLKSYGLAVFASVLAALPCLSCMGCCGLGEIIGIWALVVLLNAEVRAAFH